MPNSVVELRWIDPERDAVWLAPQYSTTGQHQSAASPQLIAVVAPRCPKLSELICGFVGSRRSLI